MSLTKTETRTIFDKKKIKKNDIVIVPVCKHKGFLKTEKVRVFGIVNEVNDDCVIVRMAHDGSEFDSTVNIDIKFADEISIVQSSFDVWASK
jgi:hypothetical protein